MQRFNRLRFRARQRSAFRDARELLERRPRIRSAVLAVALASLSAAILLVSPPSVVALDVGQLATQSVRAPRSLSFVSDVLTQRARDVAAERVGRLYRRDSSVPTQQVSALQQSLGKIAAARADTAASRDAKLAIARSELATAATAADAIDMPNEEWAALLKDLPEILRTTLSPEIKPEDVAQVRADAPKTLPAAWTTRQRRVATEYLSRYIEATSTFDQQATDRAQADARAAVAPVVVQVLANGVIVRDGNQVPP